MKYPDYTPEELHDLNQLSLNIKSKINLLAVKASKSFEIEIDKKEIFSESQFKTFKHFKDSKYTQIISFVVFYTLLKLQKPYLKALEDKTIKDILFHSDFFYKIDREVFQIYLDNSDVFESIINDYLEGGSL